MTKKIRLAHLVTHPIQYQAPLLRRIAKEPDIDLTVFFRSNLSVVGHFDHGFGMMVKWDTDLLSGYSWEFLPCVGRSDGLTFWRPFNFGLRKRLRNGQFDALWVHGYGSAYHLYAVGLGKMMGLRVLLRDDVHYGSRHRSKAGHVKAAVIFKYLKLCVDRFLAIGRANADYYLHRGIASQNIAPMRYAVDNSVFAPKTDEARDEAKKQLLGQLGVAGNRSVVLFASKLMERKRCTDLVAAFTRLPFAKLEARPLLVIAGDGEKRKALEEQVAASGFADDIRFVGFKNQSELPALYQASDVFVLPSKDEPWGLVINEAMSAGCAIVSAKEVGAAIDLVEDGVNGYTYPVGDVELLSQAIGRILGDPVRLKSFSAGSRRMIAEWDFEADVRGLRAALGLEPRSASGKAELQQALTAG
jgi:glycosyltransferase involved in cell wall biosynthesis